MTAEQRITPEHLSRRAVVYLRQSSEGQVRNNQESQRLQYALVERAKQLGFRDVDVIDADLGASAAAAAKVRAGFAHLLGLIAARTVGLVLSRELSRLSRTDKDFCQLVELCQLFGTLIGDEESIYDTNRMDDQLVLGIKATMSVVELKVLKMRMAQGRENKARRGEHHPQLPPGYIQDATGKVVKDPNVRVQEALALLFSKFRETWSIRQTFKWFRDNGVELPVNRTRGKRGIVFQVPRATFVAYVLHNSFYAGAYTFGRRLTEAEWNGGKLRKRQRKLPRPEDARVFIRAHHEGYLSWEAFEENQRMIRNNDQHRPADETIGAVRAGNGLLAGLVRCGRCGRKLYVRYSGKSGTKARYLCCGDYSANGGRYCLGLGGALLDRRVSEEVLRVLSPLGVAASLEAAQQLATKQDARAQVLARQLSQLEYEALRAAEQYHAVDARNRLVAQELERRWNDKLEEVARARAALAALEETKSAPTEEERRALREFGARFADAWNHDQCPIELKKQLLRTLLEEVIVSDGDTTKLAVVVHWKGGSHTRFEIAKVDRRLFQRTTEEDLEVIRKMAPRYGDDAIARVLVKLGRHTGKGNPWSETAVKSARHQHGIAGRSRSAGDSELLTMNAAARHAGVSNTTIVKLVNASVLPMQQVVPFAPWEIRRADIESAPVRAALAHLERTGRLPKRDVSTKAEQEALFSPKNS